jgi:phosphatidylglycerol:prolipoprotein diacylglycerol transferase
MAGCQLPQCVSIGVDPIAVHLGAFNLYWYGILVAAGFIVAIWMGTHEADREGLDGDQVLSAILVAALFGLLGARLFYLLENDPGHYLSANHLGEALSLWQGGLSFYGGIFGGALGAWIYAARYELPVFRLLDLGALMAPLGLAIGRVGNVINGDILGYRTNGWGVEYTSSGNFLLPADALGRTQQPVAIYELALDAALFGLLFWLYRRRVLRTGQLSGLFLAGWAAGQLMLQTFRATPAGFAGLKLGQVTALPLIAGGLWLFARRASAPPEPARQAAAKTA